MDVTAAGMIGMHVERSDETIYTRYPRLREGRLPQGPLGSIAVITDENDAVVERLSHDAWGKRRFPNVDDDPAGSITSHVS